MNIDNTRILGRRPLLPPAILIEEFPLSHEQTKFVGESRLEMEKILKGKSDKLLVIVGPCSIHDTDAAIDYAQRLKKIADKYRDELFIVMRVYFEKPRTVIGWKGLINDPNIDGSFEINKGLRTSRKLLLDVLELGLPTAAEFLDMIIPQFIADAICWVAIGARTTESQVHRELASGSSMPVGFKNGTTGDVQIAIDAVRAARGRHWFPSVTKQGVTAIFQTKGNDSAHVILRGGTVSGTNYDEGSIAEVVEKLKQHKLPPHLIVDCSHGNSSKDYRRQPIVAEEVAHQISNGSKAIAGVMIESNLVEGRQDYKHDGKNVYGQSITDACISIETTAEVLKNLAKAVKARRKK